MQAVEAVAKIDQIDRRGVPARFEERTAKRTAEEYVRHYAMLLSAAPAAIQQVRPISRKRQFPPASNPRSNKGSGETNAVFSEAIAKL